MRGSIRSSHEKAPRKRKSRFGCRNCKLRKLKCDETKPNCARCRAYHVQCNFAFDIPDLQPISEQIAKQTIVKRLELTSPFRTIDKAICTDEISTFFELDWQDRDLLDRFRRRTVYSLGSPAYVDIYEDHMLRTAFTCPFLLHGLLAVTAVHDRYLGATSRSHRSIRESHHWSQCTILFNKWLKQPIKEEHKDPLWATAGCLAILTFSSVTACSAENSWPLETPESYDLQWIRLGTGKMALWHLVNPLRPNSVFRTMSETFANLRLALPRAGTSGIPVELVQLCNLDESSTGDNNPYFTVAHGLSRLLEEANGEASSGRVLMVSGQMHDDFEICLQQKDPVALLLLCLWYTKARKSKWWIDARARYELPAICIYLQRYYKENTAIQALLPLHEMLEHI